MMPYTLTADDLQGYFVNFAKKLFHAPGAAHLGELAATSKATPRSLLADLTAKLARRDRLDHGSARPRGRGCGRLRYLAARYTDAK